MWRPGRSLRITRFEECVSGFAMIRRLGVLRPHPRNFHLQQFHAGHQLILRMRIKWLAGQKTGGIGARLGTVVIVHYVATSCGDGLLSMAGNTSDVERGSGATGGIV